MAEKELKERTVHKMPADFFNTQPPSQAPPPQKKEEPPAPPQEEPKKEDKKPEPKKKGNLPGIIIGILFFLVAMFIVTLILGWPWPLGLIFSVVLTAVLVFMAVQFWKRRDQLNASFFGWVMARFWYLLVLGLVWILVEYVDARILKGIPATWWQVLIVSVLTLTLGVLMLRKPTKVTKEKVEAGSSQLDEEQAEEEPEQAEEEEPEQVKGAKETAKQSHEELVKSIHGKIHKSFGISVNDWCVSPKRWYDFSLIIVLMSGMLIVFLATGFTWSWIRWFWYVVMARQMMGVFGSWINHGYPKLIRPRPEKYRHEVVWDYRWFVPGCFVEWLVCIIPIGKRLVKVVPHTQGYYIAPGFGVSTTYSSKFHAMTVRIKNNFQEGECEFEGNFEVRILQAEDIIPNGTDDEKDKKNIELYLLRQSWEDGINPTHDKIKFVLGYLPDKISDKVETQAMLLRDALSERKKTFVDFVNKAQSDKLKDLSEIQAVLADYGWMVNVPRNYFNIRAIPSPSVRKFMDEVSHQVQGIQRSRLEYEYVQQQSKVHSVLAAPLKGTTVGGLAEWMGLIADMSPVLANQLQPMTKTYESIFKFTEISSWIKLLPQIVSSIFTVYNTTDNSKNLIGTGRALQEAYGLDEKQATFVENFIIQAKQVDFDLGQLLAKFGMQQGK